MCCLFHVFCNKTKLEILYGPIVGFVNRLALINCCSCLVKKILRKFNVLYISCTPLSSPHGKLTSAGHRLHISYIRGNPCLSSSGCFSNNMTGLGAVCLFHCLSSLLCDLYTAGQGEYDEVLFRTHL